MSKKHSVVILDIIVNVNSHKNDARARHLVYGEKLASKCIDNRVDLIVISLSDRNSMDKSGTVHFYEIRSHKYNVIAFLHKTKRIIKLNKIDTKVIVSGDPWESFIAARILNFLLNSRSKIQVQIHADLSENKRSRSNLKEKMRTILQVLAIKKSDQVRVVSKKLQDYVLSVDQSQQVVVAPIPITLFRPPKSIRSKEKNSLIQIGFFGRLHPDRGTKTLVNLVEYLNRERKDFQVVIAGSGPDEGFLRDSLGRILNGDRFTFLGQLNQKDLAGHLGNLDVYFSLAPSESYGLGLREAILLGIPVIALKSNGVLQAQEQYGEDTILILEEDSSPSELSALIDQAMNYKTERDFDVSQDNELTVEKLVYSWLELSDF